MNSSAVSEPLIRKDVFLNSHVTMKIGGPAQFFTEPQSETELIQALAWAKENGAQVFILGKGSNVVFDDAGYPGLVISMMR